MNHTKISAKTAAGIMSNRRNPFANTRQRRCEPSKFGYGRKNTVFAAASGINIKKK